MMGGGPADVTSFALPLPLSKIQRGWGDGWEVKSLLGSVLLRLVGGGQASSWMG
jgi:hypothetical protein